MSLRTYLTPLINKYIINIILEYIDDKEFGVKVLKFDSDNEIFDYLFNYRRKYNIKFILTKESLELIFYNSFIKHVYKFQEVNVSQFSQLTSRYNRIIIYIIGTQLYDYLEIFLLNNMIIEYVDDTCINIYDRNMYIDEYFECKIKYYT